MKISLKRTKRLNKLLDAFHAVKCINYVARVLVQDALASQIKATPNFKDYYLKVVSASSSTYTLTENELADAIVCACLYKVVRAQHKRVVAGRYKYRSTSQRVLITCSLKKTVIQLKAEQLR